MFIWNTGDLNPEQEAAVLAPGNVFLTACPGSGKTRTLTYKIAYELERLTSNKQRIVAITYTNRAADEIRDRIESLGVDTQHLWIGTIHAFCLEWILRPYAIYHPLLAHGFGVISPHDGETILEELLRDQNRGVTIYDCNYFYTSETLQISCEPRKRVHVADVITRYQIRLAERRLIDFELILKCACELIVSKPAIAKILSSIFSFILVDEYQDTKEIQYAIIGSILRAGRGQVRSFVVGDPNQAIYGSLGGYSITPQNFANLTGLTLDLRALAGNYRSSTRIVTYFENYNLHRTQISAVGSGRDFASLVTYDSLTTQANLLDKITRLVTHSIEDVGISQHEICILAPQWMPLASLTRRLIAAMPQYNFDGPGMVPFARDPENFWYKLARIGLTQASPKMYVKRLRWAIEVLQDLNTAGASTSTICAKALLRASNAFHSLQNDGLRYLSEYFDAIFAWLAIDYRLLQTPAEHHRAFFESSQARIDRIAQQGAESIRNIETFRKVFAERSGITISTIHGVKGGEFDVVVAYGLLQGMVPHFNDPEQHESAAKLLYVTCSRARKHLHLISERGRPRGRYNTYAPTEALANTQFDYDHF